MGLFSFKKKNTIKTKYYGEIPMFESEEKLPDDLDVLCRMGRYYKDTYRINENYLTYAIIIFEKLYRLDSVGKYLETTLYHLGNYYYNEGDHVWGKLLLLRYYEHCIKKQTNPESIGYSIASFLRRPFGDYDLLMTWMMQRAEDEQNDPHLYLGAYLYEKMLPIYQNKACLEIYSREEFYALMAKDHPASLGKHLLAQEIANDYSRFDEATLLLIEDGRSTHNLFSIDGAKMRKHSNNPNEKYWNSCIAVEMKAFMDRKAAINIQDCPFRKTTIEDQMEMSYLEDYTDFLLAQKKLENITYDLYLSSHSEVQNLYAHNEEDYLNHEFNHLDQFTLEILGDYVRKQPTAFHYYAIGRYLIYGTKELLIPGTNQLLNDDYLLQQLHKAIELGYLPAHKDLGDYYFKINQLDKAIHHYEKATYAGLRAAIVNLIAALEVKGDERSQVLIPHWKKIYENSLT